MQSAKRPTFLSQQAGSTKPVDVASNHFSFDHKPGVTVTS